MAKFRKGQSGNPKGRPPVLLPEVQDLIERDRNAVRVTILQLLNLSEIDFREKSQRSDLPMIERIILQCIERIGTDGDVQGLRLLLEIPLGKPQVTTKDDDSGQNEMRITIQDWTGNKETPEVRSYSVDQNGKRTDLS